MIDMNDPNLWTDYNWDEPIRPIIKSQHSVSVTRANHLRKGSSNSKGSEINKELHKDGKWREKIAEACRKPLVTPWGEFPSRKEFDEWIRNELTDIKINFQDKQQSLPHLYYYIEDGPGEVKFEDVKYTPYGCCPPKHDYFSLKIIHKQACDAGDTEALKNKRGNEWFQKMSRRQPDNYYIKSEPKREWFYKGENKITSNPG